MKSKNLDMCESCDKIDQCVEQIINRTKMLKHLSIKDIEKIYDILSNKIQLKTSLNNNHNKTELIDNINMQVQDCSYIYLEKIKRKIKIIED